MNIDGRRSKIVIEHCKGQNDQPANIIRVTRETRSSRPQVFYSLDDLPTTRNRQPIHSTSTPLSEAERAIHEHELSIASLKTFPSDSWDSSTSTSPATPVNKPHLIDSTVSSGNAFEQLDTSESISEDSNSDLDNMPDENPVDSPTPNITGDGALLPQTFHGTADENAEIWLSYLDRYAAYKHLSDQQKFGLFKVLLRDIASDWMMSLPNTQSDTLANFTVAFKERFQDNEALKYKSARDLFLAKQTDTQSVDAYVTGLLKIAQKIGQDRNADITRYAILSGLKPQIASQVLMSNPTTTDAVIERARLAEIASVSMGSLTTNATRTASINDEIREQQVRQLTDELARLKLSVAELKTTNAVRTSRSPTPQRRVSFRLGNARSTTPPRNQEPQQTNQVNERRNSNWTNYNRQRQQRYPSNNSNIIFPRYQRNNNIICDFCSQPGHILRFCPRRLANVTRSFGNPRQNFRNQY